MGKARFTKVSVRPESDQFFVFNSDKYTSLFREKLHTKVIIYEKEKLDI